MRNALLLRSPELRILTLGIALTAVPGPEAAAVSGVCPDGSVYIVQHERDVPCAESKRVEPHQVPPLRPNLLPRPYMWEVYRERAGEQNPYNLVDGAEQVRTLRGRPPVPGPGPAGETGAALQGAAPPAVAAGPLAAGPLELGLSDGELRDLFFLVEVSQEHAPAHFVREDAMGNERLRVSLAHSAAFEARLRQARGSDGPVLLYSVQASEAERFHPNFTVVQGHLAFQPDADDPAQIGVLQGTAGELQPNELILGYLVLPSGMDLALPVDVYWNDRQLEATFRPH